MKPDRKPRVVIVSAIRDGGSPRPDFVQALHVQQIVEAIDRSNESRRWEAVENQKHQGRNRL